tara:strand:- start:330 stop:713 length:384 start_codon:yes stop_codon:yes gene_type:complete
MINGIKPIVSNTTPTPKKPTTNGLSFDDAMTNLLFKIQENYSNWRGNSMGKVLDLSLKPGRKFIKVVEDNRVWGFVSLVDGEHKGAPIKVGDIMKAAGWRAAAKHSRGSIFDAEMHKSFSWTGPNYL